MHVVGDDCSEDYDACDDKPCIPGQNCTDLNPDQETEANHGYNCSACPTGFEEKDGKCAGINEVQPVLHDWCNKGRGMSYPVWFGAYKITLAVNRKSSLW